MGASACSAAAAGGHLDILQYLRSHNPPCPWHPSPADGYLGRWQHLKQPIWQFGAAYAAARAGHLEILQWLLLQDTPCPIDDIALEAAAAAGHMSVLQWLVGWMQQPSEQQQQLTLIEGTLTAAAGAGQLATVQYLRSLTPPCPWDSSACAAAAECGRLDILQWLRSQVGGSAMVRYAVLHVCMLHCVSCYRIYSSGQHQLTGLGSSIILLAHSVADYVNCAQQLCLM